MSEEFTNDNVQGLVIPEDLDVSKISTFADLPLGRFEAMITGCRELMSKGTNDGIPKKMVLVQFSIVDTPDSPHNVGRVGSKFFVFGTKDDPMCAHTKTWKDVSGQFFGMLRAANVAVAKGLSFQQMAEASVEAVLLIEVKKSSSTNPDYDGRHDIKNFLPVGSRPLEYFNDPDEDHVEAPVQHQVHQTGNGLAKPSPKVFDNE